MRILSVEELNMVTGGAAPSGYRPSTQGCPPPPHACNSLNGKTKEEPTLIDTIKNFIGDVIEKVVGIIPDTAENLDNDVETADGTKLDCPAGAMPVHTGYGAGGTPVYSCARM